MDAVTQIPRKNNGLSGLGRRLVEKKLIGAQAAIEVQHNAEKEGNSFFVQAVKQNAVPVSTICDVASREFGMPVFELDALDLDLAPLKLVPHGILEKYTLLPLFRRGATIFVATGDPANQEGLDEIRFNTGLSVSPVLADPTKLSRVLESVLSAEGDITLSDLVSAEKLDEIDLSEDEEEEPDLQAVSLDLESPIVQFVNKILQDAIRQGASDIHIENYEKTARIRLRIDGVLYETFNPPKRLVRKIVARFKILSGLDIAERRLPQDGRMKIRFSRLRTIDFRISTMPTLYGEKLVIRILESSGASLGLETIGMEPDQLAHYKKAASQPHGMILVTGPTGSGKTVTLYSALNLLNTPERNISSVEDPVEINISGINQVSINEKAGVTFPLVLRAFLRQDPDVLMIGEIRDVETAEIAVKAAQTGHLVLATLHTNDAAGSLSRLVNMGIAPFLVASSVNLIIAQRLVRRLCDSCRRPISLPEGVLLNAGFQKEELPYVQIFEAVGCSGCTNGFRGRTGIFEALPISPTIRELLMQGASEADFDRQARAEGVQTLRQAGLRKVAAGITTLEELERVTMH